MANDYFNPSGSPGFHSPGASVDMRSEFAAIGNGFNKLPGLTGNGGKVVIVDPAETGLIPDPQVILHQADIATGTTIVVTASGFQAIPAIGHYFTVTGTGFNITGFNDSWVGRIVTLELPAGLTLVNSATLLLNGGFDRYTFAGDTITLVNKESGVWKELDYKYLLGKPMVIYHRNGTNSAVIIAATITRLDMTTASYDPYGMLEAAPNFRVTIPTDGIYRTTLRARVAALGSTTVLFLFLYKNGTVGVGGQTALGGSNTSPQFPPAQMEHTALWSKGDTITLAVQLAGGNANIDGSTVYTYATVEKVG